MISRYFVPVAMALGVLTGTANAQVSFERDASAYNMPVGQYIGQAAINAAVVMRNRISTAVPAGKRFYWRLTGEISLSIDNIGGTHPAYDTTVFSILGPVDLAPPMDGTIADVTAMKSGVGRGVGTHPWSWRAFGQAWYEFTGGNGTITAPDFEETQQGSYEIIQGGPPPPPGAAGEELESCNLDAVVDPHERVSN